MFTVTIEQPDDETQVVRVGKREICRVTHDSHGWEGMELVEEVFESLRAAGYCKVIKK